MKLRPYQQKWLECVQAARGRVLVVGPTGAGKTVVAAELIRAARREGKRVLFIAHRRELVNQCVARLFAAGVIDVGVIMSRAPSNPHADVQVASVQTYVRRPQDVEFDLVIIDEAHHATAKSYQRVIESNPRAQLYGLTATPRRLDGKPLSDLFDSVAQCEAADLLIARGALAKVKVWTHPAEDLRTVKRTGGDYDRTELGKRVKRKSIGNAIDHWVKFAECRPAVCFAVNVEHAKKVVAEFERRKYRAALVVGSTPTEERAQSLADLATGEVQVVVTVEVLTEGWDAPHAACCIMLRPTLSETLCLQMMGRCMRPNEKWPFSVVLDHVGNTLLHGMPFTGRDYSNALEPLERRGKEAHGSDLTRVKECPVCGSAVSFGAQVCGFCEHVFWEREPEEVTGWLKAVNRDVRAEVVDWVREHGNVRDAARRFNVSQSTVHTWCLEAKVSSALRHKNRELREKVIAWVKSHGNTSEAARKFGVGRSTVKDWCKSSGVNVSWYRSKPDALREEAIDWVRKHGNATKAAERFGVSRGAIRNWCRASGVRIGYQITGTE